MNGRDISTIAARSKSTPAKVQTELRAELKCLADEAAALAEDTSGTVAEALVTKPSTRHLDQLSGVRRVVWDVLNAKGKRLACWTVERLAKETALHEVAVLQALKAMSIDGLVERSKHTPFRWQLKPKVAREV